MIKNSIKVLVAGVFLALMLTGTASAHVNVKPAEAETAAFQTFTVNVPTEKEVPTVKVRILIPDGLKHVSPNVKPGWTIDTRKEGAGEEARVNEIIWTGGSIPDGQRDEFSFSAQLPDGPTTLQWKAYQTYEDGEEVAWDQAPSSKPTGSEEAKPYSVTKVVKESSGGGQATAGPASDGKNTLAIALSVVAIVLSTMALTRKR